MTYDPTTQDTTDVGAAVRQHEADKALKTRWNPRSPGDYHIRICPPLPGPNGEPKPFAYKFGRHYKFDVLRGLIGLDPKTIVCPHLTLEQDCFACKVNESLYAAARNADGRTVDQSKYELAGDTRASQRWASNIVLVTEDNQVGDPQVKVWEYGVTIFRDLTALYSKWQKVASISHPQNGFVLCVTFEQRGRGTSAKKVAITPTQGPIPLVGWHTMRHNIEKMVLDECPSPAEVRAYFAHQTGGAQPAPPTGAPVEPSPTQSAAPAAVPGGPQATAPEPQPPAEPQSAVVDGVDVSGIDPKLVEVLKDTAAKTGMDFATLVADLKAKQA